MTNVKQCLTTKDNQPQTSNNNKQQQTTNNYKQQIINDKHRQTTNDKRQTITNDKQQQTTNDKHLQRTNNDNAQKALFKVPKICNINFWTENDPPPFWHFSENSSDLVARPFPKCSARLGRGQQLVHLSQQQFRHLLKISGRESVVFTDIDSLPDSLTNQNN